MSSVQKQNLQSRKDENSLTEEVKRFLRILGVKMSIHTNFKPPLPHGIVS